MHGIVQQLHFRPAVPGEFGGLVDAVEHPGVAADRQRVFETQDEVRVALAGYQVDPRRTDDGAQLLLVAVPAALGKIGAVPARHCVASRIMRRSYPNSCCLRRSQR